MELGALGRMAVASILMLASSACAQARYQENPNHFLEITVEDEQVDAVVEIISLKFSECGLRVSSGSSPGPRHSVHAMWGDSREFTAHASNPNAHNRFFLTTYLPITPTAASYSAEGRCVSTIETELRRRYSAQVRSLASR